MASYLTKSGASVIYDDDVALPGCLSIGSHGYAQLTGVEKDVVLFHRWLLGLRRRDGLIGDHIDGNPLDCRRRNLRVVNASQSSANVRARAKSGFRGVYPNKSRWIARCKQNGRIINLGTYDTAEEAATVSGVWRMQHLAGFTGRVDSMEVAR